MTQTANPGIELATNYVRDRDRAKSARERLAKAQQEVVDAEQQAERATSELKLIVTSSPDAPKRAFIVGEVVILVYPDLTDVAIEVLKAETK